LLEVDVSIVAFPGSIGTANFGISPTGQIVGQYTNPDGSTHGFLAMPTP
jgi:probable HAF family extracellular repeat protein